MSYIIQEFSQDKYRFRLYDNVKRLTWQQIQAETGCTAILNLAYFDLTTYQHRAALMIAGKWVHEVNWHEYGICIDQSGTLTVGTEKEAEWDYAIGCPPVVIHGVDKGKGEGGRNGWTYTGVKPDGTVVALLCSKDTPEYTATLEAALRARGCTSIIRWDGSWSSQGTLGAGKSVTPSQRRICRSWLLIYERAGAETPEDKEDDMSKQYTVTPSVGVNIRSGPGTGYGKVGAYPQGTAVTVLEERDGWGRTTRGWVCLDYLATVDEPDTVLDTGVAIRQDFIPAGRKNRPGGSNPDTYITIHETGNAAQGADAAAHASYLKGDSAASAQVSWHYTVDDHAVVQHLPDGERACHAGDGANGPGNTSSIGIEICVNAGGNFAQAKANAASLVRQLMVRHNIPLDHVVQHNRWNGKDCPYTIRHTSGAWEAFLSLCESGEDEPPAGETDRVLVQRRFQFADETMDYLEAYQYADALLERLATAD